ncbi:hypothetical protein [Streptomyces alanosinicus]|uniref:Uncharacterized protein n=1 Tax=Streptomyces alanosinicus TaxID=68171 RepID=A0A918INS8_9ACTN|nr:hypothetical protein [Streptomyces alanosinicus]GGW24467.1 hypothetical protein GCM10010339_94250 [Streptomyces alanosinicus]
MSAPTAQVDSEAIRQSYDAVLWAPSDVSGEQIRDLLLAHVQLLGPEVSARKSALGDEHQQCTAQLVLTHTHQMLERGVDTTARDVWDLAVQCRALHTLYLQLGPLDEQTAGDDRAADAS